MNYTYNKVIYDTELRLMCGSQSGSLSQSMRHKKYGFSNLVRHTAHHDFSLVLYIAV